MKRSADTSEGSGGSTEKKIKQETTTGSCLNTSRGMQCKIPKFLNSADFTTKTTMSKIMNISNDSMVIRIVDAMPEDVIDQYIQSAIDVHRVSGPAGFGKTKPREEVCYSVDGKPYVYSGVSHRTTKYPSHVLELEKHISAAIDSYFTNTLKKEVEYKTLSTGVDIVYSDTFPRGGSIAAHSDDEDPEWGMVVVFSLGQTRIMRFRSKDSTQPANVNVAMHDNSIVIMYGKTFQQLYTHQIDKLSENEPVGTRLSLNFRYKGSAPNPDYQ